MLLLTQLLLFIFLLFIVLICLFFLSKVLQRHISLPAYFLVIELQPLDDHSWFHSPSVPSNTHYFVAAAPQGLVPYNQTPVSYW
jgi:hypothetical protein